MPTVNTAVTTTWTKVAETTDLAVLMTWNPAVVLEIATTTADTAPTVAGHRLSNYDALTREVIGTGYLWARIIAGSRPTTISVIVTK